MSKDLWHTPPQTPDVFKSHPIIVVYEAGDQIEQMDSKEYSDLVGERYVNRWCYLDDLIACEQELIRTRKALGIAVDALKRIKFRGEHSKYECCKVSGIIAQDTINKITELEQKDK